jgi:hypothetical protein
MRLTVSVKVTHNNVLDAQGSAVCEDRQIAYCHIS